MIKVAVLDDYQNAFKQVIDLEKYKKNYDFKIFNQPFVDESEAAIVLEDFEAIFIMRERTPMTKSLLESLPKLKYIMTSGMRNQAIDFIDNALRADFGICAVLWIDQENGEFVTTEPGDDIGFAGMLFQNFGNNLEHRITRLMAICVIDRFEFIQVQHHQRAGALGALVGGQRRIEAPVHAVAIGEAGKRIVFGQARILQLALEGEGDVLGAAAIAMEAAVAAYLGMAGQAPPARLVALAGEFHHQV